ncbi:hypothetical protein [Gordonia caeni]|uniref:Uncharacterized protein n=1 Tax=Gordonia caeni TaxID=1007097 RepID=A0ABP7PBH0_9ACTN
MTGRDTAVPDLLANLRDSLRTLAAADYMADVLPEVISDDRRHVLADDCWCEPTIRPYRRIHEGASDE